MIVESLLLRIPGAGPQGVLVPSNCLSSTRFCCALRDIGGIGRPWPVMLEESTGASATDVPWAPDCFRRAALNGL